ncbi:hypothetical protein ACVRXQ_02845 [Streptococcus panodentis]|uniref:Lipoprotein n=1 Tax=Streptococcus panodentis TaxID=1581472 RepID=A0ABS5AYX6_9STRE|nr:hypothetical protein [Streptococcus panodentis]MBP2621775.1 hypothetical protein [Streptococcus panodentis]
MKKIVLAAVLLLTGILLTGCTAMKRAKIEERFSRISEVYPTANAEDLFKKFPKGVKVRHLMYQDENVVHEILLEGYPSKEKIEGTYIKTIYKDPALSADEVTKIPISYSDKDGVQALDGQILDSKVRNVKFFFTNMMMDAELLKEFQLDFITENPVSRTYSIGYQDVQNKMLNQYIGLSPDEKLNLELFGDPKFDRKDKYFIGISVKAAGDSLLEYFSEIIEEK